MADFGFVGPAYEAPSKYQNSDETINWFIEKDPTKQDGQRGQYTLYPTPGLILKALPAVGEVRGMRTVQGGATLLAIVGASLYSINAAFAVTLVGHLSTSAGPVSITDNGAAAYFCDALNRYALTFSGGVFSTIAATDGPFAGGGTSDVVDGFMVYHSLGSQQWAATTLNSTATLPLSIGKKDGAPDNIVALIVNNREVFLLGEYTSEVWVDVGSFPFPFSRVPGTSTQHGCAARNSVARLGNSFAFVSQDLRGQGVIVVMNGYAPQEISNHAVTNSIANQPISDAVAWSYQMEGHEFYVVNFPSIDLTWVYDASTLVWHKWLSVDASGGYHRHRANCRALFQGLVLVGDYQNGSIYQLDNATYTDAGTPIRRLRRSPHLVADFTQQFFDSLQIQFQPGVGLVSGQGVNPQAMLRWSNDGGSTWSNEHWRSIGVMGKFRNRAVWRKLGTSRDRVFEVVVTDPVRAVIVGADLQANGGDN